MSSFPINIEKAANAFRQKGFQDGERRTEPNPPADPDLARAYMASYRRGAERRGKVESA